MVSVNLQLSRQEDYVVTGVLTDKMNSVAATPLGHRQLSGFF